MSDEVKKKTIPHPSEVPSQHHDKVMAHVAEQFAAGHYGVEQGSVSVTALAEGRDQVSFVRTHDASVEAEPHGLDLA